MIITCNECESSFQVDDRLIQETGSKVRCSKCSAVFVVYPPAADAGDALQTDGDEQAEDLELGLGLDLDDEPADGEPAEGGLDDLESELNLDDFDESGADQPPEAVEALDSDESELDLNLDLDLDDEGGKAPDEVTSVDDELPDLEDLGDLAGLDDEGLDEEDLDAELENIDSELAELDIDLDADDEADEDLEPGVLDLDDSPDTEPGPVQSEDSEDLGLDLDFEEQADAADGADVVEADELDLSDLELDLEDGGEPEAGAEPEAGGEDLKLGDETAPAQARQVEEADELDLSDLELDIEDEGGSASEPAAGEDNLELDLGGEAPEKAGEAAPGGEDESSLDLSDLEDLINSDEPADAGADTAEELDLEFQVDEDGAPVDEASETEAANELDLSDLNEMLESDDVPAAESAEEREGEELELEFDTDGDAGADDMLDIEQLLEDGEQSAAQQDAPGADAEELELDLEMDSDAGQADAGEADLELDLEGELEAGADLFEESAADDQQLESNLLDEEDVALVDEIEEEPAEFTDASGSESVVTDDFATDEFSASDDLGQTSVLSEEEDDLAPAAAGPAPKAPKVRSKKPALIGLLVLILAIGILIVPKMLGVRIPYISDIKIPYLSDVDMRIPFLSDLINPEKQDVAGNLKINPMGRTINGRFVESTKAGRLFVIQGKIRNDYDHPRSFIKVTGRLFQKGGKEVKNATVYCGNVLSAKELAAMNMSAITRRLKNKFGDRRSNIKVPKGRMLPFMIVFDHLPHNLDEFSVEVAGSSI